MVRTSIACSDAMVDYRVSPAPDSLRRQQITPAAESNRADDLVASRFPHRGPGAGNSSLRRMRIAMPSALLPLVPPTVAYLDQRWHYVQKSVRYNDSGQMLDIWRGQNQQPNAPVLIWVPGGAWVSGTRMTFQGHPLLSRMVERGWVCLSIDYRWAPWHRWPQQLEDVRAAVDWRMPTRWSSEAIPILLLSRGLPPAGIWPR